ncbi:MAG: ankyrin repeat domain-containing protein, partial [Gemmatimonadota bacterium]|nr:ankyrin repeat domain-containing protein [Gemmatimonadota bacterium]
VGTLEVLLKNNAPVNLPNNNGETPLFYAFKAGKRADIVTTLRLLLEGGADRHHEDNQGRTPEQITRRVRRPEKEEIIRLFENW